MASLPFKHPKGCTYALFSELDLEGRGRADYGDLEGMAASIKLYGLMQAPLAVPLDPPEDGKRYRLVTGGRRTLAMQSLNPSHIPITLRHDIKDRGTLIEMELEENIQRKDMSWTEECLLIRKAHLHHKAANIKLDQSWGTKQTGRLFNKSAAHVTHALVVADKLIENDVELAACTSLNNAYSLLLARKEQEVDAFLSKRILTKNKPTAQPSLNVSPTPPGTGMQVVGNSDELDALINGDIDFLSQSPATTPIGTTTFFNGRTDFPLSEWCTLGDSVKEIMPSWPDACVDHIITDPPYGIEITEEHLANAREIEATHDRSDNLAMFPEMLRQFYRVLKDRGYCIFWIDIEHIDLLKTLARKAGFSVQNHPIVWVKTHQCKNLAPGTNFTNKVEHAIVCRKGTATLQLTGPDNVIVADGSVDRKLYSNPFAKPYAVWAHLIQAVSRQGDTIADPYAGQMSCPRACINLGRIPKAVELESIHYNKGITILSDTIKEIAGNSVSIS